MSQSVRLNAPSLAPDAAMFVGGAALVAVTVWFGVPALSSGGMPPLAAWMALAIPLVFAPILVCGWWIVRREASGTPWLERLRLRRPSGADWLWGAAGLVGIAAGSAGMFGACAAWGLDPNPPFARNAQPLATGGIWQLGLWAVYWPFNILGEELVWRGVSLPRMEARLGERAWALNAALWGAFHTAFGLGNLLVLLPTLVLVPWVAQRRRNTWLAVLMHAGLSLPGFVGLALGWP
jgi:membrane protease YdiL (CAAX protease family)